MIVNATSSKRVTLGRLGENKTRTIRFDIREIKEEFPGAEFMVLNRRPTESAAYPVSSSYVTVNGHHLDWTVQSGDLLYQGMGECEIVASVDDKIAKTQIYLTEVLKALDGAGNPPAPWKSWVDDVEDAADRAEAAAAVAVHAPEIVEGVWYVWDAEQGEYVTTGVTAEGQEGAPGQDGYSPAATVSKSGSTATISITDKNGTTTASVSDGDPSAIIDDTAGSGDTGKVWSADKSAELLSALHGVEGTVDEMLVERFVGETVTLTNTENTLAFFNGKAGTMASTNVCTYEDGLATFKPLSNSTEKSPYVKHDCAKGSGTWLVGFKFRFTKTDSDLGNPENFRVYLGASNSTDISYTFGEWIDFSKIVTTNLTRIYITARNFETAPTKDQLQLEVKEMYVYDVASVDADMRTYIANKQITDYRDGTAIYTIGGEVKYPKLINAKNFGVKGDGVTDDTSAIRSLFLSTEGDFYFPDGTYKITGTITLPKNSSIVGDGDTTVFDMSSCDDLTECVFRSGSGGSSVYPYIYIHYKNCAVRNVKIIGNDTLQEKRHAGIAILDTEKCTVEDVTIYNINFDAEQDNNAVVSGYGILVTRSQLVSVERCHVVRCGYECIGIVDDCNYCVVRDCYAQDGWRTCIQVHRGSCNTLIENCFMKQTHTKYHAAFTVHGVSDYHVKNLSVNNCVIECTQNGAQPDSENAPAQIMSYTDNTVFTSNRVSGGKRALYIDASSYNAKIMGNEMQCNEDSDYGVTLKSHDTIVIGNRLDNQASTPVNLISYNPILVGNIGIS